MQSVGKTRNGTYIAAGSYLHWGRTRGHQDLKIEQQTDGISILEEILKLEVEKKKTLSLEYFESYLLGPDKENLSS